MKLSGLPFIRSICILPILFSGSGISLCGPLNRPSTDTIQLAEKVYLHIDRKSYTTGDDIWFRAYVIDPANNRLSLNTNNLYVDLVAPDATIIQSRILRIVKGLGNGDFQLPDSVPTGIYRIRAYTSHMRNYDDDLFFVSELTIVNPWSAEGSNGLQEKKIGDRISIQFFPEGGSLVENVSSAVAFKAVDAIGNGCDVSVELYDSDGELMTIFNSNHLGMGFFNLKPLTGEKYYVTARAKDGTEVRSDLPTAFPAGISIRTTLSDEKNLILTTATNEATFGSIEGKELSVVVSSRNLVNKKVKIRIDSLENNFLIPLNGMPSGIIRITVSEFEGLPLAERLFFLQKEETPELSIFKQKMEYGTREKVILAIMLNGDSLNQIESNFSLSAAKESYCDNSSPYPETIASWFLLQSDVKGIVEQPSYYFDPSNKKRFQDLDLLLMTQGWRDFRWKYDSASSFRHEIGFDITGSVRRVVTGKQVSGSNINLGLFYADKSLFQTTKTNKEGIFRFDEMEYYGRTEAFISSTDKLERIQGKILVDSMIIQPPETMPLIRDSVKYTIIEKEIPVYRQVAIIRSAEKSKYKLSDTLKLGEVEVIASKIETPQEVKVREVRRFYSNPDKEIIVNESEESYGGDVFSFISGKLPGVIVERGVNPRSIYYPDDILITIRRQFTQKGIERSTRIGALILMDGYEVDSSSLGYLLSLPMKAVDRIDVLTASPLYGMRGANGVINIITKVQLRRDPVSLNVNSTYQVLKGFDIPRIFFSPDYQKPAQQASSPDYRSTLFWKPDISLIDNNKTQVSYFNDDEPGKVRVIVEGITGEGIPLSGRTEYVIK